MAVDPLDQPLGSAPNVVDDDRYDGPTHLLHTGESGLVPQHLGPAGVPLDAFVLGSDPRIRPREVDPPSFTVGAADRVLQLGQRQPVVDHHKPGFALHRRLRTCIRERQQPAHRGNAASAALITNRPFQLARSAPPRPQSGVMDATAG